MTVQLPNDDGHFQQDNVLQHAAKLVEEWFEKHYNECIVLNSPDNL